MDGGVVNSALQKSYRVCRQYIGALILLILTQIKCQFATNNVSDR